MKKIKTKNILVTVGIVILLAVIVYVRSRISPLIGNYSVEKNEKKCKIILKTKAAKKSKKVFAKELKQEGNKKVKIK